MSDYFSYEEKERAQDLEKAILQYERDLYEREKHFNKEQIITELKAEIDQLKQQLAEKQKTIDEINKEFVQAIHDWKTLCAEKDKEIEDWKQKTQTFLNRVNEQNYEIANNNPKQLAIQELEKVKNFVDGRTYCANYIKKRIKELKGEKDVED